MIKLFATKSYEKITLKGDKATHVISYPNEIIIQESCEKGKDIVIMFSQMFDKDLNVKELRNMELNIDMHCKNIIDEEEIITKKFKNMSCKYLTYNVDCNNITEYVYVFADDDEKVGNIKKEINELLNRRNNESNIENVSHSLNKFQDEIREYKLKCEIAKQLETNALVKYLNELTDKIIKERVKNEENL